MIQSKHYFIDQLNSSKANQFTMRYHYSHVGFKKAKINLGIYRISDNHLVGVLQWGCSAQEGIRLDRYVKEPITTASYLELNRFCMADSEGRNSESEAISLGIKWIKQNRPDIQLLVSYAGRKEGNYGYIYQATNWEYLGYFISNGFWFVDGEERHQITLWSRYKQHLDTSLPFTEALCKEYHDVRQTWTKQFIYIQRLNKKLHRASPLLPYPKPSTDFPVCTDIKIYKQDDDYSTPHINVSNLPSANFVYIPDEQLFTREALLRRGEIKRQRIAVYSRDGELEDTFDYIIQAAKYLSGSDNGVSTALQTQKLYKNHLLRWYEEEPLDEIEVDCLCTIDGQRFFKQTEVAEYCGVSRQAVSAAKMRGSTQIAGREIKWNKT